MMASVYRETSQLIIWPGDDSKDSATAITTVRQACKELEDQEHAKTLLKADLKYVNMKKGSGELNLED